MTDYNHTQILTMSGKYFDLANPDPNLVCVEDIAAHLGKICRWTGATSEFYSVAQHSVHVSRLVEDETNEEHLALLSLLHDAHEAYTGDISRPMKVLIGVKRMRAIENRIQEAIMEHFGLFDWASMEHVWKESDNIALFTERRDFMRDQTVAWECLIGLEPDPEKLIPMSHAGSEAYFLQRFDDLQQTTGEW